MTAFRPPPISKPKASAKVFVDTAKCPWCKAERPIHRRMKNAGVMVSTRCANCGKHFEQLVSHPK